MLRQGAMRGYLKSSLDGPPVMTGTLAQLDRLVSEWNLMPPHATELDSCYGLATFAAKRSKK